MIEPDLVWDSPEALAAAQATAPPEDTRFWWVEIVDQNEPEPFDEVE
jgi:hypothetical protein